MSNSQYAPNYTGDNLDYRIFNEERKITHEVDKVIVLDFGAFFTKSLVVRNKATGLKLRLGQDYECTQLDYVATKESGQEVTTRIWIKTDAVKEIQYDYMFVGGDHMNGLHLLKALREKYPNGIENTYQWDKVTNKPETFRPKFHTMHVNDIYGLDGAIASVDRIISGLQTPLAERTNKIQSMVTNYLTGMGEALNDTIDELNTSLENAFENLSVQEGEYIFTDSSVNPSVSRGYGNWVRVTNTVLRGTNGNVSFAVDDGNILALGSDVILRNCYIWRNQETNYRPTYALSAARHDGLSATQRAEEKDIVFTLQTTGITTGGKVGWVLVDKTTGKTVGRDVIYGDSVGEFEIDSSGRGTTTVKFKANTLTPNTNKTYILRLTRNADVKLELTIVDTSARHFASVDFIADIAGTIPITTVNEGQDFYLQLTTVGYGVGESIFLDWSYSSVTQSEMVEVLPNVLSNPTSNKVNVKLKAKEDMLIDNLRTLLVYVVKQLGDEITSATPYAKVNISDSSRFEYADISFNSGSITNIFEMDEGVSFEIRIKTPLPNAEIELLYESSRTMSDFVGLTSLVTTNSNGEVKLNVHNAEDFLTAKGTQNLTVIAYYNNKEIGRNQVFFKDTSKSPNYVMFYSTTPGGTAITSIAEGSRFYFNIRVDGWTTPSRPPVLNFLYYLNDNPTTTLIEMNTRIISTFYENMTFDSSSNVFNEVSWVNGNTLCFDMTLIANRMIDGDDTLCIAMKQYNETEYNRIAKLTLLDTSIYDVSATWSSSATTLTPITQANEMLSSGLNNTAYLWIDVDGDGSLLGDIQLTSTSIAGVDFVDVFPKTINFGTGVRRQIVAVTLYADFTNDGDKDVTVKGTYKVQPDNLEVELFNTPLKIVNNSVLTEIDLTLSTSSTTVTPAVNGYSEWAPIYGHLTFPAFAFASKVEWSIVYTSNSGQFEVESGVVNVAANASKALITLTPKRDRTKDGEATFTVRYRRFISFDSRPLTTLRSLTGNKLLDDSLPPSITLKAYTDSARTIPATSVNEGQVLYLRAEVNNPDRNASGVLRLTNANNIDKMVNGVSSTCYGVNTLGTKLTFTNESKILSNYTLSNDNKVYNLDSTITVIADRTTNPKQAALDLTAELVSNADNNAVGTTLTSTYIGANRITSGVLTLPINDTSKTASYTLTNLPTSVNEGGEFEIILNITNGTVGDVYYPNLTSAFDTSRLSSNEFGVEQVSVTENDVIRWKIKVAKNYTTDTGVNTIGFSIINKTLGTTVLSNQVTVNDTSKTPNFTAYLSNITNPAETYTVSEGQSNMYLIVANLSDLDLDDSILVERVSGRAASEFPTDAFATHRVADITFGGAIMRGIAIPFYPRYDRTTNTVAQNTIVLKVTSVLSGVSKNVTININDTSKDMAFLASRWVKAGTTTVVTSVNEGEAVELQVQTTGGAESIGLTCNNNNGRAANKLTVSSYGVTKNRTSDTQWVSFPFTPSTDATSNTGNDLMLSVRITVSGSTVTFDSTLPINDTSYNAGYTLKVIETGDTTQKAVTFMNENKSYQIIAGGTGIPLDGVVKLVANTNTYYHTTKHEQTVSNHNGTVNFTTTTVTLNNSTRTPSANLWYKAEILLNNVSVSSIDLPVVDTGLPALAGRITTVDDINTEISVVVTGNTVSLVIDPDQLTGINWSYGNGHLIRWKIVDATTNAVINNPTANDSNKTFNSSNLTTFNGGSGYKVNIPVNTSLGDKTFKIVFTEEYTIGGQLHIVQLGSTSNVNVLSGATAPAITDIYWSANQDGSGNKLITTNEGDAVYLIVKTANIPLNTVINLNWEGSTTNSNDFTTGTTDSNTTVKVTTFNTSNSTGLAFYKFVSKHDEMVDDGN